MINKLREIVRSLERYHVIYDICLIRLYGLKSIISKLNPFDNLTIEDLNNMHNVLVALKSNK